jgi:hypothetical protein
MKLGSTAACTAPFRFRGIDPASARNCPQAAGSEPGKEEFIRFFTILSPLRASGPPLRQVRQTVGKSDGPACSRSTEEGSFFNPHAFLMCSSFLLYALFALLVIVRLTRFTAPGTTAQSPVSPPAVLALPVRTAAMQCRPRSCNGHAPWFTGSMNHPCVIHKFSLEVTDVF